MMSTGNKVLTFVLLGIVCLIVGIALPQCMAQIHAAPPAPVSPVSPISPVPTPIAVHEPGGSGNTVMILGGEPEATCSVDLPAVLAVCCLLGIVAAALEGWMERKK